MTDLIRMDGEPPRHPDEAEARISLAVQQLLEGFSIDPPDFVREALFDLALAQETPLIVERAIQDLFLALEEIPKWKNPLSIFNRAITEARKAIDREERAQRRKLAPPPDPPTSWSEHRDKHGHPAGATAVEIILGTSQPVVVSVQDSPPSESGPRFATVDAVPVDPQDARETKRRRQEAIDRLHQSTRRKR